MPFPTFGSPVTCRYQQMHDTDPSSDIDDPTSFPHTNNWLHELDAGNRGIDGHNFTQYANILTENMFMRISQLENMPKEDLLRLCPSMPAGTAPLVLGYARKDCGVIRKNEMQRLRQARLEPKRYL
jgi:hypothetical protein